MSYHTVVESDVRERLKELYDEHASGLFAYCWELLGDLQGAADAVQDTFIRAAAELRSGRNAGTGWLYGLARRECQWRDVIGRPPAAQRIDDATSALVERVVRELRPLQREVLMLRVCHGLDTDALATVLDVARDTAGQLSSTVRKVFERSMTVALASGEAGAETSTLSEALDERRLAAVLARLPLPDPPRGLRTQVLTLAAAVPANRRQHVPRPRSAPPGVPSLANSSLTKLPEGTFAPWAALTRHDSTTQPLPLRTPPRHSVVTTSGATPVGQGYTARHQPAADAAEKLRAAQRTLGSIAGDWWRRSILRFRLYTEDRQYGWLWDMIGIAICVALAIAAFWLMPEATQTPAEQSPGSSVTTPELP